MAVKPPQQKVIYRAELSPKQEQIWDKIISCAPGSLIILGYGGAAGGGKTRALHEVALDLAQDYPGSKILVGRKNFSDLRSTTMDFFNRYTPRELIANQNLTEHWIDIRLEGWPDGVKSRIQFRELKNWTGLGSEEYTAVLIDEAGEVPVNSARMLLGRLRLKLPDSVMETRPKTCSKCTGTGLINNSQCFFCKGVGGWPTGMPIKYIFMAASNPYPGWFEQWFVKRELPEDELADMGASLHFVRALPSDNPHLPPDYEKRLRQIWPVDWVKRMMEGRWDAFVGQVYPQFSPDLNCYRAKLPDEKFWKRIVGGLDFGGNNPYDHFSAGVVAIELVSGRIIRVAEFEERGPGIVERQMQWMLKMEATWCRRSTGMKIHWVADKTQGLGIALWRKHGFRITASKGTADAVDMGIAMVGRRFQPDPAGIPASFYMPDLVKFPERILAYRYEEPSSDDSSVRIRPIKRGDDLMDADRYMHEILDREYGAPAPNQFPIVGSAAKTPWEDLSARELLGIA